ncbi:transcription factor TFIIE beta subunit, TFIIEB, Tfa2, partial [Coemansia sp. RSA 1933]
MTDPFTRSLGFKGRTISTALSTKATPQPASTPTSAGLTDGASVLTRVSQIIDFLKKSQRPCGVDEIQMHMREFDEGSAEFEHLANNAKVDYKDGMFAYKPEFDLRTPEELVEYLRGIPDYGGLEVKRLADSYLGNVSAVIGELRQKKHILAITDKDNRPRYIYYNCKTLETEVSGEIKTNWARMVVPDEQALPSAMIKAQLQQTKGERSHVQGPQDVKKPKKA